MFDDVFQAGKVAIDVAAERAEFVASRVEQGEPRIRAPQVSNQPDRLRNPPRHLLAATKYNELTGQDTRAPVGFS